MKKFTGYFDIIAFSCHFRKKLFFVSTRLNDRRIVNFASNPCNFASISCCCWHQIKNRYYFALPVAET